MNFDGSCDSSGRAVKGAVNNYFGTFVNLRHQPVVRKMDLFNEHASWFVDLSTSQGQQLTSSFIIPRVIHLFWVGIPPLIHLKYQNKQKIKQHILEMHRRIEDLENMNRDWSIVVWAESFLFQKMDELLKGVVEDSPLSSNILRVLVDTLEHKYYLVIG